MGCVRKFSHKWPVFVFFYAIPKIEIFSWTKRHFEADDKLLVLCAQFRVLFWSSVTVILTMLKKHKNSKMFRSFDFFMNTVSHVFCFFEHKNASYLPHIWTIFIKIWKKGVFLNVSNFLLFFTFWMTFFKVYVNRSISEVKNI